MSRDEKQAKKPANNNNLKIDRQGQQNTQMRNPFFGGDLIVRQGQQNQMRNPFFGGDLIVRQGQQNTQMENPFFGGAQLPPGLGLVAGMMGQPQNTQMGNPFFGGAQLPPGLGLQIHPKVAEKLKDQPVVGLFG